MQFKGLGFPNKYFCNAKEADVYASALLAGAMNPLNVLSKFENHFAIKTVHFQVSLEDFVRRWEMCFREYPDILTEPKNNEKLLIFIDRASRYLQTVKDRLNNDGNQNSQTV